MNHYDGPGMRTRYGGPHDYRGYRIEPMNLNWFGWKANTHDLQQQGWEFAESKWDHNEYDNYRRRSIRFRHRDCDVVGETNSFTFHPDMHHDEVRHMIRHEQHRCRIFNRMVIQEHQMQPMSFTAVDCDYGSSRREIGKHDVYGATYFTPLRHDAKKIFLEQATMSEILDIALSKQEPEQAKIRAKMVKRQEVRDYRAANVAAELHLIKSA